MALFFRFLAAMAAILLLVLAIANFVSPVAALWVLAVLALLSWLLGAINVARLNHWASLPRNRELPTGFGPWRPVFEKLLRFSRQESETRSDLLGELQRIHAAVDRLPDGLVVLDRFDHVVWSNNSAQAMHGIFGTRRPIHHFIRQPEFIELLAVQDSNAAVRIPLPGRPGRTYELRVHRAENEQKLVITRDITVQARLDSMRSDFVANVSHEIRTPVTVIAGFAETLLSLDLDEAERRKYLESILRQSRTMERLVDDLLMLSTLERHAEQKLDEQVDIHELLESLTGESRVLSAGRHEISLQLDGPRYVRAIPSELESAVRNLLTNAIRYTPEGGQICTLWHLRDAEGRITVRDTGIGIPPEHLPRIAERFYRVDRGRSRATGGTGLGLAITKRIMFRHQGALLIDSEPQRGSTFTLTLPGERIIAAPEPELELDPEPEPKSEPKLQAQETVGHGGSG